MAISPTGASVANPELQRTYPCLPMPLALPRKVADRDERSALARNQPFDAMSNMRCGLTIARTRPGFLRSDQFSMFRDDA
jgi:hypothetical protein